MSKIAFIENGKVVNVALGDQAFADAMTGAVVCPDVVGPGWSYDGQTFAAPVPVTPTAKTVITRGEFRLLFTFAERMGEAALYEAARAAGAAGSASSDQLAYLAMRGDFQDADTINLLDSSVSAALDFYVSWGLITDARKTAILANETPA